MTPQAIAISAASAILRYAIKQALTKEGAEKVLDLIGRHVHQTETKVDDEIYKVFGPAASHVLANAKKDMSVEAYEDLVFGALEMAAKATPAAWDDVLVQAAKAAAPAARKVKL